MRHGVTTVFGSRGCTVVAVAFALCLGRGAHAQSTLVFSGPTSTMKVQSATAGAAPNSVTDNSTTYTVNNSGGGTNGRKITARLNAAMPAGVTLTATFDTPSSAVSIPNVALDATSRDVVTGLDNHANYTKGITYTLSATPAAGVVARQTRTVTLTITSAP